MKKTLRLFPAMMVAAAFLGGCQLLGNDEASSPAPTETATLAAVVMNTPTATGTAVEAVAAPVFIERIQFAPGDTSATRQGSLPSGQQHQYVFGAQSGQAASVEVGSSDGSANFALAALDASDPIKAPGDPARSWQGKLPLSIDYMITIDAPGAAIYWLTLSIEALAEADLPVIMDPGSPPSDRCVVVHPGGTAKVSVYLGPSTAFAPIARLGNWAEVLSSENGWHEIQTGPGQTGWVRETDVGFTGPCDQASLPIMADVPASGSPWRTSGRILPGQANRYVFRAEAGSRAFIDLNSARAVNFALVGVDDGILLKQVASESRTWEGILPQTQDYLLTVVSADEAADYELLISLLPGPLVTVFYDAHTGAILGGLKGAFWVDSDTAAAALLGGEQYGLYRLGQQLGQATGSAAEAIGGICPGHTVTLTPPPTDPAALAIAGATWPMAPQLVAPVELSQVERQAIADLLTGQGLGVSATNVQVREAFGTDLDGDGTGEIIVQAARLKDEGSNPSVAAGDYFILAVLMQLNGRLHAEPLVLDVYSQANELAYPWRYKLSGALDFNGDGLLEVILNGVRWEGRRTIVFSVGMVGGSVAVLERVCAE